jgi:hypothetical protein
VERQGVPDERGARGAGAGRGLRMRTEEPAWGLSTFCRRRGSRSCCGRRWSDGSPAAPTGSRGSTGGRTWCPWPTGTTGRRSTPTRGRGGRSG